MKKILSSLYVLVCIGLSAADPVAFLSDIQGGIKIKRQGKEFSIESSCEALYKDDVVIPSERAEGKIVFPEAIYDVKHPSVFKVMLAGINRISGSNSSEAQPITRSIRSAYGPEDENVSALVLPKDLVANVIPAITRATEEVIVYSPKGQLFSDVPDLLIKGITNRPYEASLVKDGKILGITVTVKSGEIIPFSAFSAGKLKGDEMYEIRIKFNGKIVNDPAGGSFYLMDDAERKAVSHANKSFGSLKNGNSVMFFAANILYKKECYSEVRVMAEKLVKSEPQNILYQNLLKLANKALGYKD